MIVELLIALLIVGAVLYILPRLPIDGTIKMIIQVVIVIAVIIWLLRHFGGALG